MAELPPLLRDQRKIALDRKRTILIRTIVAVLVFGFLVIASCDTVQKYENVSLDPAYRSYVGALYEFKVAMHISGVNAPPGYKKRVDYYVVNPASPSWGGPELITRDTLPPGTAVEVESVHRCTNCLFGKLFKAKIQIPYYRTEFALPIHVPLQYLAPDFARRRSEPNQAPEPTSTSVTPRAP